MASRSSVGPLLHWLLLGGVIGLALLLVLSRPLPTNDYNIYVALGRQMFAMGGLLERDPFSFTQHGEPFQHASWGYAVLCALSHEISGYQGIRALLALSTALTLGGVWWLCGAAGAGPRAAAVGVLYAWVMLLQNLGARGQTLIYPLFLLIVALLLRPPRPWLGALAGLLIAWIWTQLHGSFPIALLHCGAVAVGGAITARSWRAGLPAAAIGLGVLCGTMLGPYGPGIWGYIHANGAVPRDRGILEWYPPSLLSFEGVRLGLALTTWAALLAWRRGRLAAADWLLLLGFGAMSLTATRIIAWLGLATAVPLAFLLTSPARRGAPWPAASPRQRWVLAVIGLAWIALIARGTPAAITLAPDTPVALADRLAEEPPGRLFAPMEASSYLAWRFHEPGVSDEHPLGRMARPYFLDMRVWIWSDEVWSEFESISAAEPGWDDALDRREVRFLLLSHSYHGAGLLPAAKASERWELLAEDPTGALLVRVD